MRLLSPAQNMPLCSHLLPGEDLLLLLALSGGEVTAGAEDFLLFISVNLQQFTPCSQSLLGLLHFSALCEVIKLL